MTKIENQIENLIKALERLDFTVRKAVAEVKKIRAEIEKNK